MTDLYLYKRLFALAIISFFISTCFITSADSQSSANSNKSIIPPKLLSNQSSSWNFNILQTPSSSGPGPGPGTFDNLYDAAWCPGKNYSVLVGVRGSPRGGTSYGISFKYYVDSTSFALNYTTNPSSGSFYGIDWNPAGDIAYVVGSGSNQQFSLWSTPDGLSYTQLYTNAVNGGNFQDVAWNKQGTSAIVVGYQGTSSNPGGGVIYKFDKTTPATPEILTPAWLTAPLYTVAWSHSGDECVIGGGGTILWTDGNTVKSVLNFTNFDCNDVAFSPDDKYLIAAGDNPNGNSGIVIVYDLVENTNTVYTSSNPLYGVSWKSTGNFAVISGDSGTVLEYSDGTITSYNTGITYTLARLCFMDPKFNTSAQRYEYAIIVGGPSGLRNSGATVIKFRQFDGENPAATASADDMADAPDSISAPNLQNLSAGIFSGYLDYLDTSDYYEVNSGANQIISIDMYPYSTADYALKLYDYTKKLIATANSGGAGVTESISYDSITANSYYLQVYRISGNGSYMIDLNLPSDTIPLVKLISPAGGEVWSGGIGHSIKISIIGGATPYHIWVNYSTDGGATYPNSIVDNYLASTTMVTLPWQVPKINNNKMKLSVFIADNSVPPSCSNTVNGRDFAIDSTPPTVTWMTPTNNSANVPVDQIIYVQFSEKINMSVPVKTVVSISPLPKNTVWSWNITGNGLVCTHGQLLEGTTYTVRVNKTAKDLSDPGNNMNYTYLGYFISPVPTSLKLVHPNGGENWSAGTKQDISWIAAGGTSPYKVTLFYSTNLGSTWQNIVDDYSLGSPYSWIVPPIQTSYHCKLKALIQDSAVIPGSNMTISASNFTIFQSLNLSHPFVISSDPINSEINVSLDYPIIVKFNNKMNTTSVNFTCIPDPGGWEIVWSDQNTTMTLTHGDFTYDMNYKVTITNGKDITGSTLIDGTAPNPWFFATIPRPVGAPVISYVSLAPYPTLNLGVGNQQPFMAQGYDNTGSPVGSDKVSYTWSLTGMPTGTISAMTGTLTTFTATAGGSCNLSITVNDVYGSKSNTTYIIVNPVPPVLDNLFILPSTAVLNKGSIAQFTAYACNGSNKINGASYKWTVSDSDIGNLTNSTSQTVTFTALRIGGCDLIVDALFDGKMLRAKDIITVVSSGTVDNPPTIKHTPILSWTQFEDYTVTAKVSDDSAVAQVQLYYHIGSNTKWIAVNMTLKSGDTSSGDYSATIPGYFVSGDIYYYLKAIDSRGQNTTDPFINGQTSFYQVIVTQQSGFGIGEAPSWLIWFNVASVILIIILFFILFMINETRSVGRAKSTGQKAKGGKTTTGKHKHIEKPLPLVSVFPLYDEKDKTKEKAKPSKKKEESLPLMSSIPTIEVYNPKENEGSIQESLPLISSIPVVEIYNPKEKNKIKKSDKKMEDNDDNSV